MDLSRTFLLLDQKNAWTRRGNNSGGMH